MRVLVTGCGGFLGSEIVRQLLGRGDRVIGLARGHYPSLERQGMISCQGDIRSLEDLMHASQGVDAVIHTAAIAGVWGPEPLYHGINVAGTQNVIAACRKQGVRHLVFSSSPSVTFGGNDQSGVDESEPYPETYLCHYPRTKAEAERAVLSAHQPGELTTCSLRPHLIWAADDPHLFHRVVRRAADNRLIRVGSGRNLIDTIHVRNAAHAHLLAVDQLADGASEVGGKAFFLSQGEPVECWTWIARILEAAKLTVPTKAIGYQTAYRLGHALETAYWLFRKKNEPPMTRFVAAQLAKDHYFNISAANEFLGYTPLISTDEGMEEVAASWQKGLHHPLNPET